MKCILILTLFFFLSNINADDSFGTHFITTVLNFKNNNFNNCKFTLTFLTTTQEDVAVSVKYDGKNKLVNVVLKNGQPGTLEDICSIFEDTYDQTNQIILVKDPRILIDSTHPIKVFVRYYSFNDDGNGVGDTYLIYPTYYAGWQYVLRLPKATSSSVQLISIIPIDSTKPLSGQLVTYKNGVYRETFNFIINPTIDNIQALFVGDDSDGELAFNIHGTTAFIVTAAVPCVDLNYESTRKPSVDMLTCDYVAFMPFPIYSYDCQSTLSGLGEIKLLGGQFTNAVYETAGIMLCANDLLVDFYVNNVAHKETKVQTRYGKSVSIDSWSTNYYSTNSLFTNTHTSRFGGNRNRDGYITDGFLTNVPDMTQTISESTQIFTLSEDSYLEVYGADLNPNSFKIDNNQIANNLFMYNTFPYYQGQFDQFIIQIQQAGIHTFYSDTPYILYVTGKNNNQYASSYGYLAGYGDTKLTAIPAVGKIYPGGNPDTFLTTQTSNIETTTKQTTTTIMTTTKNSSITFISKLISILSLFIILFV